MENIGIVYFIQPSELVGTNRYKIGCSKQNNLNRCRSYRKGSRYICIQECQNPLTAESKIKQFFSRYHTLIAGREYFEGDETDMLYDFMRIVYQHKKDLQQKNKQRTEVPDTPVCGCCPMEF